MCKKIKIQGSIMDQNLICSGTISDLALINPKTQILGLSEDSLATFLPMECVGENGRILKKETRKIKDVGNGYTCFTEGDVLFAKITPCMENGKGAIACNLTNGIGYGSTEFHVIRPKTPGDSEFIFQLTKSDEFRVQAKRYMTGSAGQQRVPSDIFINYKISIPPFPERCKIATILSSVDAAIEQTDAVIAQTERMKMGLMQELFTKGMGHTEFKETPIGRIPVGWDVTKLIDAVGAKNDLIVAGPFGSNLKVSDYRDEGIPIIRLQNIEYGKFIDKDIKYISAEKALELSYHSFLGGDLVLAKLGDPIGKTCIVPAYLNEGIVVADVVRIRTINGSVDKKYILYILNSISTQRQLISGTIGTTRPRVNLDQIRGLIIPLPQLTEQRKIAAILSSVDERLAAERNYRSRLEVTKKGLMQDLLTGRVPVKVDGHA